jgi:hypothetical protein
LPIGVDALAEFEPVVRRAMDPRTAFVNRSAPSGICATQPISVTGWLRLGA